MQSVPPNIKGLPCPLCGKVLDNFYFEDPDTGLFFMQCTSCQKYIKYVPSENKWVSFDYEKYAKQNAERKTKEKIANKSTEAREWLKNSLDPTPLAGNRFKDASEAYGFVQNLYNKGAVRVEVQDVDEPTPGYRYTDTLIVAMPKSKELRDDIFKIYNEESQKEGVGTTEDQGQTTLTFWWD